MNLPLQAQGIFACAFNQILARQSERVRLTLRPFQGKVVRFAVEQPVLEWVFRIGDRGVLEVVDVATDAASEQQLRIDVAIQLQGGLAGLSALKPPLSLERLLAQAHISGNAELADAVSFLARNLSVSPGDYLQPVLGDILTNRFEKVLTCGSQHSFKMASHLVQKLSR